MNRDTLKNASDRFTIHDTTLWASPRQETLSSIARCRYLPRFLSAAVNARRTGCAATIEKIQKLMSPKLTFSRRRELANAWRGLPFRWDLLTYPIPLRSGSIHAHAAHPLPFIMILRRTKIFFPLIALLFAGPAKSAIIVDTGTPVGFPDSANWAFVSWQYFAGEFSVATDTEITGIHGYFSDSFPFPGTVTFALHSDGGDVPGAVLFSTVLGFSNPLPMAWHGFSSLNWDVGPGSYWVSFQPSASFAGVMPGVAPDPLSHYAVLQDNTVWAPRTSTLGLGIQVHGTSATSVPDSGSTALVITFALSRDSAVETHFKKRRRVGFRLHCSWETG